MRSLCSRFCFLRRRLHRRTDSLATGVSSLTSGGRGARPNDSQTEPAYFVFRLRNRELLANHLPNSPRGRLIVKNIHLVLCGTLERGRSSPNRPKNRNDSRLFLTARLRYGLPPFTLAVGKEPPLDYRPDYALFENRLSFLDKKAKLFSEKPSVRRRS